MKSLSAKKMETFYSFIIINIETEDN